MFFPVFEARNDEADGIGELGTKQLARAADAFEWACKRAKLRTLYDFYSMTRDQMIAEILLGDPENPSSYDPVEAAKLPEEQWFDAASGVELIRFLMKHARENPGEFAHIEGVLDDLQVFEQRLLWAGENGIRWHLAIIS